MSEEVSKNNSKESVVGIKRLGNNRVVLRKLEFLIWLIGSIFILLILFVKKIQYDIPWGVIIEERYFLVLLSFALFIYPIIFLLVFGKLPFENIRDKMHGDNILQSLSGNEYVLTKNLNTHFKDQSPEDLLITFCHNSKSLAKSIYNRAGVYLLVGVMAAFSGLVFFYTQTLNYVRTPVDTSDITEMLINLSPKFGILFFIELVAFYFLRLYKTALEDFRYYESIQRKREEMLLLFKLSDVEDKKLELKELISLGGFISNEKVQSNQNKEILNDIKLEKNEITLLTQIIRLLNRTKD